MAYKFQLGAAVLSGSIKAEEGIVSTDVDDATAANIVAQIDAGEIPIAKLAESSVTITAGDGLSGGGSVALGATVSLAVGVDDSSIETNSDVLRVKASGVTNAMLAGSIANAKLANSTISGKALGASLDSLSVDDSSIEYSSGGPFNGSAAANIRVKASGVTNSMLAGSITNNKLSNSTISGIALGANLNTLTRAANSGLAMSSYNGSAAVSDLAIDLTALADASVDVSADSFAFADATDGSSKVDSIADLMTAVAGNGLAASSGVLAVGVDDSSIELNSDALRVKASGVTNAMLAGSIANAKLANSAMTIAGTSVSLGGSITTPAMLNVDMGGGFTIGSQADDVATFTGGVIVGGDLTVNGSVTSVNSSTIEITSSFTFEGATPDAHETVLGVVNPTADATINLPAMSAGTYFLPVLEASSTTAIAATPAEINAIADASARSAAAVDVSADHFMFCDGGATGGYKVESLADYATAIAGDGLAASAGVLAIGVDDSSIELNSDALRIKASGVTNAMLAGSIADSKLNQITTANKVDVSAIDIDGATDIGEALVNADLLLVDNGAGGTNRKVTMSRLKTYIGGGSYAINVIGDANATLAVGMNAPSEAATASRTWTLPASADLAAGETILIKAYGNAAAQPLTIAQAGSQEIDGSTENLVLESNNAAIQLVYVAADTWCIF